MKKLSFLFGLVFTFTLHGQITITSNDFIGTGKVIEEANDLTPAASIKPGPAGANQTWDFSDLVADEITTTQTLNPDWTPYSAFFPSSNLALYLHEDSVYIYMQNSTAFLLMLGMFGTFLDSIEMPVIYTPPLVLAEFPVQYQNHKDSDASFTFFMPISGIPGVDSAKLKMDVLSTTDVDAWGTITTPLGTFDALRMYTVEESTDSIWYKFNGFWTPSPSPPDKEITYTYSWWSNDNAIGFQLLEFDYFSASDSVAAVTFLNATPTQSITDRQTSSLISVYPNPADTYINFDYDGESDSEIEIFNNIGKLLLRKPIIAKEITRISVEQYPSGIYFYNLIENNGNIIDKGRFCKR